MTPDNSYLAGLRAELVPASYEQERLWLVAQLNPHDVSYNVPIVLRIDGHLDEGQLQHALAAVAAQHEILRTNFIERGGQPFQAIRDAETQLTFADMTRSDADAPQRAAAALVAEPFDLAAGPLIRVALFRAVTYDVLTIVVHHSIFDAGSLRILLTELDRAYRSMPTIGGRGTQYADYALWQRQTYYEKRLAASLRTRVAELTGAPLKLQLGGGSGASVQKQALRRKIDPTGVSAVRALAASQRVTFFGVLLAGLTSALCTLATADEVLIGIPASTRTEPETQHMIGFFINIVVFRGKAYPGEKFGELIQRTHANLTAALRHQHLPFHHLVAALRPPRALDRVPLASVTFNYLRDDSTLSELFGHRIRWLKSETDATHQFETLVSAKEHLQDLELEVVHDDKLSPEAMSDLLDLFVDRLRSDASTIV